MTAAGSPASVAIAEPSSPGELIAKHPLFAGCNEEFCNAVAGIAERVEMEHDDFIDFEQEQNMLIVESGAVKVTVGRGPLRTLGPGFVINTIGMLGRGNAATECAYPDPNQRRQESQQSDRSRRSALTSKRDAPYEPVAHVGPAPVLWSWGEWHEGTHSEGARALPKAMSSRLRRAERDSKSGAALTKQDILGFFNLCPYACQTLPEDMTPTGSQQPSYLRGNSMENPGQARHRSTLFDDQARMRLQYLSEDDIGSESATCLRVSGSTVDISGMPLAEGTVLMALAPNFWDVLQKRSEDPTTPQDVRERLAEGLTCMHDNVDAQIDRWRSMSEWFGAVLPGAPLEVLWAATELSYKQSFVHKEIVTSEGDEKDIGDQPLVLITSGRASVEKLVGSASAAVAHIIGKVNPGAFLGDICLLGAEVPRPALVRAEGPVDTIVIPASAMTQVLGRYPGVIAGFEGRARAMVKAMQIAMPTQAEVLSSLELFQGCDQPTLEYLASICKRRTFWCGECIKYEEEDDCFFAIEYGKCCIESGGKLVGELATGDSLGETVFLARVKPLAGTVRVTTPFCIALALERKELNKARVQSPAVAAHLAAFSAATDVNNHGDWISRIPAFRKCGSSFVSDISGSVQLRAYMPGQTIVVQGAQDKAQMFSLKGGVIATERLGRINEMRAGATLGELAMLGMVRHRSATVRALTFCFVLEIPRVAFLASLGRYPEERGHFEELAIMNVGEGALVKWPVCQDVPARFNVLMNLYAERLLCQAGDRKVLQQKHVQASAMMVLAGEIAVLNRNGEKTDVLVTGSCRNEQAFIELPAKDSDEILVAEVASEVQLVSVKAWNEVIKEFPEQQIGVRKSILKHMAERALERRGIRRANVLRQSVLFRAASHGLLTSICDVLEDRVFRPGEKIVHQGDEGGSMFWFLDGTAELTDPCSGVVQSPPQFFGEAALIGINRFQPRTITATSVCVLQVLHRTEMVKILMQFPDEDVPFRALLAEAQKHKGDNICSRIRVCSSLFKASPKCLQVACQNGYDAFFEPGDVIEGPDNGRARRAGDRAQVLHVIFSGQAVVEVEHGIPAGSLGIGTAFGDKALSRGLSETGGFTIRSDPAGGLMHCAVLFGCEVEVAIQQFPDELDPLLQFFQQRKMLNEEFASRRKDWLEKTVLPALTGMTLFHNYPKWLLGRVAAPLMEVTYMAGETICAAGEQADSMMVLLEGAAEIRTSAGQSIGEVSSGASWGEVALLGLFATRMATMVATSLCAVVTVPMSVLSDALSGAPFYRELVDREVAHRHEQVAKALPFSALQLRVLPEDPCVRGIALLSQHVVLKPQAVWTPVPDTDPCGPHFGVITKGFAYLEMMSDSRFVTTLKAGDCISEGMAVEYQAHVRAMSVLEFYRIREFDFTLATCTIQPFGNWLKDFQDIQKETRERLHTRLDSAQGVVRCTAPHSLSMDISLWGKKPHFYPRHARRKAPDGLEEMSSVATSAIQSVHALTSGKSRSETNLLSSSPSRSRRRPGALISEFSGGIKTMQSPGPKGNRKLFAGDRVLAAGSPHKFMASASEPRLKPPPP